MNDRFYQFGWVMAAALGGVLLASGFQGATNKIGVVDVSYMMETSAKGKATRAKFDALKASRENMLKYLSENSVATPEQAQTLHDLLIKETLTPTETEKLNTVKAQVSTATSEAKTLAGLGDGITDEQQQKLVDYTNKSKKTMQLAQRWFGEFTEEMQKWADQKKQENVAVGREVLKDVAKKGGYSVIFETDVAPYGANDISDEALKALNEKN